ncbi:MAG: hypothetical protein ACRDK9_02300 [Solirubrobacterales bacterium]
MSRSRRLAAIAGVAVACLAAPGLAACGDDEDEPALPEVGSTGAEGLESQPATSEQPDAEGPGDSPATPQADDATGGAAGPAADAGHEGGGPDPGTEEAESAAEAQGENGPSSGGAGPSPTESFEQFCEENPEACD